ncbi:hypothetical protein NMY22_g8769 [Coprinellus aureogranulatus]|nr:hypothetical protein NMY22_g8769 [Coprinellus aureogranulatus]
MPANASALKSEFFNHIFEQHPTLQPLCQSLWLISQDSTTEGMPDQQRDKVKAYFQNAKTSLLQVAEDERFHKYPDFPPLLIMISKLFRLCFPQADQSKLERLPWYLTDTVATTPSSWSDSDALSDSELTRSSQGFKPRSFSQLQELTRRRTKQHGRYRLLGKYETDFDEYSHAEYAPERHCHNPSESTQGAPLTLKLNDQLNKHCQLGEARFSPQRSNVIHTIEGITNAAVNDDHLAALGRRPEGPPPDATEFASRKPTAIQAIEVPDQGRGASDTVHLSRSKLELIASPRYVSLNDLDNLFALCNASYTHLLSLQTLAEEHHKICKAMDVSLVRSIARAVLDSGIEAVVPRLFENETALWSACDRMSIHEPGSIGERAHETRGDHDQ